MLPKHSKRAGQNPVPVNCLKGCQVCSLFLNSNDINKTKQDDLQLQEYVHRSVVFVK